MAKTAIMKVWDVELGLAIHIVAPNGKYIVIDLGSRNDVNPLKSLWGKNVGYMIITHPHYDHFSDIKNINYGKPEVLWRVRDYSREELLLGVRESEKKDFEKYCDFCDSYYGEVLPNEDPTTAIPFDGLTVNVFSTSLCNKANKNNFSAIVVLKLGNAKIVVCGDNEIESFERLMVMGSFKNAVENACVLVAAHHGRETGYYDKFVELVKPYLTIISDTTKGDTSVTDKYANKTTGYSVYNNNTNMMEKRKCLTTRNDGNIMVEFGEIDDIRYCGTLSTSIHCRF